MVNYGFTAFMKAPLFFVLLSFSAAWAQFPTLPTPGPQSATATQSPDTVIATFGNGERLTIGELKSFIEAMPPQMQQNAMRDRKAFVQQFALMHRLAEMAEAAKLDQRSPTKESLAFNRMYLMMNAQLHEAMNGINIAPAEAQALYDKNKERFNQVKVKAIYVSFSESPSSDAAAKKHLTETEAQAKIEKIRAEILKGADFVKLVKENSDDQTSAAKDGDFGTIRRTDNLPDAIRNAVFALKTGEVSPPVHQPNGFYLFRAEEISAQPFSEVQQEIFNELKQARFKEWMDSVNRDLNLKYENESFFNGNGGGTTASR
jgi:peptidyl-prolyl cis-trans isomerase C